MDKKQGKSATGSMQIDWYSMIAMNSQNSQPGIKKSIIDNKISTKRSIDTSKIQAAPIKTSLFNYKQQQDYDDYEPIVIPQRRHHKKQQREAIVQCQREVIVQCQQIERQPLETLPEDINAQMQANRHNQDNQQIVLNRITTAFFQIQSQEQGVNTQQNMNCVYEQPNLSPKHNAFIAQQQTLPNKEQHNQQDNQKLDILTLNQKVRERSSYFQQIINEPSNQEAIIKLMSAPLLNQTKQIFQVYVSSSIIGKSFTLAMDCGKSIKLLMKAQRSLSFNKTSYEIQAYLQNCNNFLHLCTLQSDADRRQYNIIKQSKEGKNQLLGTIINRVAIKYDRYLILYYPQIVKHTNLPQRILEQTPHRNLYEYFQDKSNRRVDYLITTKFTQEQQEICMKDYGFKKSGKSMQFKDSKGNLNLIIGKKQSKRYQIIAGPGITPIQIFCTTIVNIQI